MCCLITCYSISVTLVQDDCRGRDRMTMVVGFTTTCPIITITTKVVSSNPAHCKVYSMYLCDKVHRHDVTEILLKVALNTLTITS